MPRLAPELILRILAHVDQDYNTSHSFDLLSCSLVCRQWYQCALPFLEDNKPPNRISKRAPIRVADPPEPDQYHHPAHILFGPKYESTP
ncbi:hypothetical protein BC938DRAFT_470528 [Jimgerdemannia flammicorona]|uniref:F-box domain-containing protein n=1 Tax=Jimgerdemannia flammicorona TaxID=994334 RepID=A0A433QA05_9FUNG|nr:hypothetical protein BC938DRAFT_470528 [Jimgerdemannia flammicorona]